VDGGTGGRAEENMRTVDKQNSAVHHIDAAAAAAR